MPIKHTIRFGLNTVSYASREDWKNTARRIESLGYSTLSVGDHLWTGLAPLTSLMAAADATTTLRVGSCVFANDFRHPVALAREAATLDVLSGGRLEFGIGTGWQWEDYESMGIPFDPPGTRVSRLEEAIQLIKASFGNAPVTFSGNYYKVTNLNAIPKPEQQPHPPLLIGGGSRRMLSIAAREADIVGMNTRTTKDGGFDWSSFTAEATLQRAKWVQEAAGDRFNDLELNMLMFGPFPGDNIRESAEKFAREWGVDLNVIGIDDLLASPYILFGGKQEIVDKLQTNRERYGFSYFTVFGEDNIDAFAPVVAHLAGT